MGLVLPKVPVTQAAQVPSEFKGLRHPARRRQPTDWAEVTHRLAEALELALTDPAVTRFEQLMARIDAQLAPQTKVLRRSVLRALVKSSRTLETSEAWWLETAQHVLDDDAAAQTEEIK